MAVELPDDVRRAVAGVITTLRAAGPGEALRWSRAENVHLTLKFLGDVAPEGVAAITHALRGALVGAEPFEVRPTGIGTFHGAKGVVRGHAVRESYDHNLRVVWIGMHEARESLGKLASRVEGALAPLGFPTEKRPFYPHLTLARIRERADRELREQASLALAPFLESRRIDPSRTSPVLPALPPFRVERIALMQSIQAPEGMVHRALESFALGG